MADAESLGPTYAFGPFLLEAPNRRLFRDARPVPLQPKAFDLLLTLVERQGQLVTKDELLQALWPDVAVEEANLTQNVYVLRKALGQTQAKGPYIETVQKHGYRFVADVRLQPEAAVQPARQAVRSRRRLAVIVGLLTAAAALFAWFRIPSDAARSGPGLLQFRRITTSGSARTGVISRDGRYIAYTEAAGGNTELWLQQRSTRAATRIVVAPGLELRAPAFTSDAAHLFYIEARPNESHGTLRKVASLGGEPATIATAVFGTSVTTPLAVSPDDRWVAFVRHDQPQDRFRLVLASAADGGHEREAARLHDPERFGSISWQWAGPGLAYSVVRSRGLGGVSLRVTEPIGGGSRMIAQFDDWSLTRGIAWLPSDRALLVIARSTAANNIDQVFRIGYPDGQLSRVTNDLNSYDGLSLTANGGSLLTVQLETVSRIWVGDQGGEVVRGRNVTSGGAAREGLRGMSWTQDDRIVFEAEPGEEPNLWIMDADGRNRRQLTSAARWNITPTASRDGRYIVFSSNRSGSFAVWRMDTDGRHPTQLASMSGGRVAVTPDSRWVVLPAPGAIWKFPIGGGSPVHVASFRASGPAISPDGGTLAVISGPPRMPSRIVLVRLAGPQDSTREMPLPDTVFAPSSPPISLAWTPDGRAVAYPDSPGGVSNLWIAPLDGSPRRQITSFTEDRLSGCSWNFSGTRLACVRYAYRTDVVEVSGVR